MIVRDVLADRGQRYRWLIRRRAPSDELVTLGSVDPLLAQLLLNRGIADSDEARQFLAAGEQPLGEPRSMAGVPEAVARLEQAIASGELVAIYGDYDVDGVTGTAVLCRALDRLGATALPFIPHRERDGYGLQDAALDDLQGRGASLVVTVDCGVTAIAEVARARQRGLDVIVTDHHQVPEQLPDAAVVINPRRADCAYPFKELAGVGVAFKLAEALLRARLPGREAETAIDQILELAAIGTLADVVALRGENRTIVQRGLERLNAEPSPGLRALLNRIGLASGQIDAEEVCFALVPRLNAAGRLADAGLSLDLLLTDSREQAERLVEELEALNTRRKSLMADGIARAQTALADRPPGAAIVLAGEFPLGIVGPLAGRLAEEYQRPAIVLHHDGERCAGSARSVDGVDVVRAMRASDDLLDRYGGHAMAAGLSFRAEHLHNFEQRFCASVATARGEEPPEPAIVVDAELRAATACDWLTMQLLRGMQPCGPENPEPLFVTRGLRVLDRRLTDTGHLRLRLGSDRAVLRAIAFRTVVGPDPGATVDVAYHLKRRAWHDQVYPELVVRDWRQSDE